MSDLQFWTVLIEMIAAISALGVSVVSLIAMYVVMRDRAERKRREDGDD